jgi:membrane protein implicated in regulation of membrane protease activity
MNKLKTAFFVVLVLCLILSAASIVVLFEHGVLNAGTDGFLLLVTLTIQPVAFIVSVIVLFVLIDNVEMRYKPRIK